MFDVGVLLANQPLPAGQRVGIVTNSSALGVLAAGACGGAGLLVAPGYPVDLGPQADAEAFVTALVQAAGDVAVDALIVLATPPWPADAEPGAPAARMAPATPGAVVAPGGPAGVAARGAGRPGAETGAVSEFSEAVAAVAGTGAKPVVAVSLAGDLPPGVPSFPSVEEAVRALARVTRYAQWRRTPPGQVPDLSDVDRDAARTATTAEALLAAYGVPVLPSRLAVGAEAAVEAAGDLGYPVVLKVADQALRQRPDLGAVRLDLAGAEDVVRACGELDRLFTAGTAVIVQRQVAPGVAWVVEVSDDPAFGPIVGFGPGGVIGELLDDRAWRAAPLSERDALALVREPRAAPLLLGHRGAQPVDVEALVDLLLRVGRLADEQTRVRSLVLNPVLARRDGLTVLHASVHYGLPVERPDSGPRRMW
jgi:acyl-CoA synthetase (NDP forming)